MNNKTVRTRFAPSPTGYMHIGNLRTALYAYLYAKNNGGTYVLRIEDTDLERYTDGAEQVIYNTLKSTGLVYDEGPDVGGDYGPYIQSERKGTYLRHAEELVRRGGAYYCFCTKERLDGLHSGGAMKYDKHCAGLSNKEVSDRLSKGEPYVMRQNIPTEGSTGYTDLVFGEVTVANADMEDNILIKSDGMPTYNFANVVDDHLMGITHVIRGTEYLSSTPKYIRLYEGLGWERPEFMHLQPVMKDQKRKFSKRHGDPTYEDLINQGFLKEAIINYIALLGWSPKDTREKFTLAELIERFSVDGLSKSASIFDIDKLKWLNAQYIKETPAQEFLRESIKYFPENLRRFDLAVLAGLLQSRVDTLSEVADKASFLLQFDGYDLALFDNVKLKADKKTAEAILPGLIGRLESSDFTNLHDDIMAFIPETGMKNGQVLWALRIAITGALNTPGGAFEMAAVLGKQETVRRAKASLARLLGTAE